MDTSIADTLSDFGSVEVAAEGGIPSEANMPSGPWRLGRRHAPRPGGKKNLEDASSSTTLASVALAELEADNLRLELEERDEWLSRVHIQLEESQRELDSYRAETGRLRQVISEQKGRLWEYEEKQSALVREIERLHARNIAQAAIDNCVNLAVWKRNGRTTADRSVTNITPQLNKRLAAALHHEQRRLRSIREELHATAQMQRTFMMSWHRDLPLLASVLPQLAASVPPSMLRELEEKHRNAIRVEFAHLEQTLRLRESTLDEREARVADLEAQRQRVREREQELAAWETRLRATQQSLEEQRQRMERLLEGMIPVELVEARERNLRHRESAIADFERSVEKSLHQRREALQAEQAELEARLRDEWARFQRQCETERRNLQNELERERMFFREKIEATRFQIQTRFDEYSGAAEAEATAFGLMFRETVADFASEVDAARQMIHDLDIRFRRILDTAEVQIERYHRALER
jgi:peptidoglycan hydrolase CwlO-like protein